MLHLLYHPPAEHIAPVIDEIQHRRVVLLLNDDGLGNVVELLEHFDIAESRGDSARIGPELLEHGFKTDTDRRREMIARYEARTGRAMRDFPFYRAFAIFKLAIIMEGSYSRFLRGQTDDPLFIQMKERVPALADLAWSICQRSGR